MDKKLTKHGQKMDKKNDKKWIKNGQKIDKKWTKWTKNGQKIDKKLTKKKLIKKDGQKIDKKLTKMDKKWTKNWQKIDKKLIKKMDKKWTKNRQKIDKELFFFISFWSGCCYPSAPSLLQRPPWWAHVWGSGACARLHRTRPFRGSWNGFFGKKKTLRIWFSEVLTPEKSKFSAEQKSDIIVLTKPLPKFASAPITIPTCGEVVVVLHLKRSEAQGPNFRTSSPGWSHS